MAAKTEKKSTGTRYTDEKKKFVLDWYKARQKHSPWGAQKATMEHFGISYVALRSWLRDAGMAKPIGGMTNAVGTNVADKRTKKAWKSLCAIKEKELTVMRKILKSFE